MVVQTAGAVCKKMQIQKYLHGPKFERLCRVNLMSCNSLKVLYEQLIYSNFYYRSNPEIAKLLIKYHVGQRICEEYLNFVMRFQS